MIVMPSLWSLSSPSLIVISISILGVIKGIMIIHNEENCISDNETDNDGAYWHYVDKDRFSNINDGNDTDNKNNGKICLYSLFQWILYGVIICIIIITNIANTITIISYLYHIITDTFNNTILTKLTRSQQWQHVHNHDQIHEKKTTTQITKWKRKEKKQKSSSLPFLHSR